MGNFSFSLHNDGVPKRTQLDFNGLELSSVKAPDSKKIVIFGGDSNTNFSDLSLKDAGASIFSAESKPIKASSESQEEKNETEKPEKYTLPKLNITRKGNGMTSIEEHNSPGGYKCVSTVKNAGSLESETQKMAVKDKNGKTAFIIRRNEATTFYEDKNGNTLYTSERNGNLETVKNAKGNTVYTCLSEYDPKTGETNFIYKNAEGKVITSEQAHKLENSLRSKEMKDYAKCLCEAWKSAGGEVTDKNNYFPITMM